MGWGTQGRKPLNLTELPFEILSHICSELCLHCQVPYVVEVSLPEIQAARKGQRALAYLSRCSKRLLAVAQPILFHYYSTDKPPRRKQVAQHSESREDASCSLHNREGLLLGAFLRTIIQRPDLARHVQALTIDPEESFSAASEEERTHPQYAEAIYRRGASKNKAYFSSCTFKRPKLSHLQDLVMVNAPSLSQLYTEGVSTREYGFRDDENEKAWPFELPNLRYLVFPGAHADSADGDDALDRDSYHLEQMKPLLKKAPNLEVLIAPDCDKNTTTLREGTFLIWPWDVSLPHLRRLSLNAWEPDDLATILATCPMLEDLEVLARTNRFAKYLSPENHMDSLKKTLRRFCYSILLPRMSPVGDPEYATEVMTWGNVCLGQDPGQRSGLSFRDFTALEVLEIDQLLLYGPNFPPTNIGFDAPGNSAMPEVEEFMAKLPVSIRILHIGWVAYWPLISRDLLRLAEGAASRFPNLTVVRLDYCEIPSLEQARCLINSFAANGIAFSLGSIPDSNLPRGMLPPRPGRPETFRREGIYFLL
jgi:hypothetical protein